MTIVAALLQTDTTEQQQQAARAMAGLGFGVIAVGLLFGLAILCFTIFLVWRIMTKAGMAGPLSLLILLWPIGLFIVLCILAFGDWKVAPLQQAYAPPLPPNYPPQNFPPAPPSNYPPATY